LILEYEYCLNEHDDRPNSLERIFLFVHHPEYYVHKQNPVQASIQDQVIIVAASLSGVEVVRDFFRDGASALQRLEQLQLDSSSPGSFWQNSRHSKRNIRRLQIQTLAEKFFRLGYPSGKDSEEAFETLPESFEANLGIV